MKKKNDFTIVPVSKLMPLYTCEKTPSCAGKLKKTCLTAYYLGTPLCHHWFPGEGTFPKLPTFFTLRSLRRPSDLTIRSGNHSNRLAKLGSTYILPLGSFTLQAADLPAPQVFPPLEVEEGAMGERPAPAWCAGIGWLS